MVIIAKFLVTVFAVVVLLWLAVVNRVSVPLSLEPFSAVVTDVPLPVLLLSAVVFGFLWGAAIVWLNGAAVRKELRLRRRELKTMETRLDETDNPPLS